MDDGLRIWRSFKMGKLLDLIMLDTRNYDRSVTSVRMFLPIASELGRRKQRGKKKLTW